MEELGCDPEGKCMKCFTVPPDIQVLLCDLCNSQWHMSCLKVPLTHVPEGQWQCPDCSPDLCDGPGRTKLLTERCENTIISKILSIQAEEKLSDMQKAQLRQELFSGLNPVNDMTKEVIPVSLHDASDLKPKNVKEDALKETAFRKKRTANLLNKELSVLGLLKTKLCCVFCLQLPKLPVSAPCGHNFCFPCLRKWVRQKRNTTCGHCRVIMPVALVKQIRVNAALARIVSLAKKEVDNASKSKARIMSNRMKPDKAFTSERAVRNGIANASSGRILVTAPQQHYGPITKDFDPVRRRGVLVGDTWTNRLECRQWGAHFPHVAAFSGQAKRGCQSIVLSTGYADDEDHGDWFISTGSGGHDLSGNKRTSKEMVCDQTFTRVNKAMHESCCKGYPVRVIRSCKLGSVFAPESGLRYDGIYRIEMCWQKTNLEGFRVCRFLFVRCDNEPPPWARNGRGDKRRLRLPPVHELKLSINITRRKEPPSWGWEESQGKWGWLAENPNLKHAESLKSMIKLRDRVLEELECPLCEKLMKVPISTPCGHNFCKGCLELSFSKSLPWQHPFALSPVSLRVRKAKRCCPCCNANISDVRTLQVNHQILDVIMSLGEVSLTFGNECERLSNQATLQTTVFPPAATNAPCGIKCPELRLAKHLASPFLQVYKRRFPGVALREHLKVEYSRDLIRVKPTLSFKSGWNNESFQQSTRSEGKAQDQHSIHQDDATVTDLCMEGITVTYYRKRRKSKESAAPQVGLHVNGTPSGESPAGHAFHSSQSPEAPLECPSRISTGDATCRIGHFACTMVENQKHDSKPWNGDYVSSSAVNWCLRPMKHRGSAKLLSKHKGGVSTSKMHETREVEVQNVVDACASRMTKPGCTSTHDHTCAAGPSVSSARAEEDIAALNKASARRNSNFQTIMDQETVETILSHATRCKEDLEYAGKEEVKCFGNERQPKEVKDCEKELRVGSPPAIFPAHILQFGGQQTAVYINDCDEDTSDESFSRRRLAFGDIGIRCDPSSCPVINPLDATEKKTICEIMHENSHSHPCQKTLRALRYVTGKRKRREMSNEAANEEKLCRRVSRHQLSLQLPLGNRHCCVGLVQAQLPPDTATILRPLVVEVESDTGASHRMDNQPSKQPSDSLGSMQSTVKTSLDSASCSTVDPVSIKNLPPAQTEGTKVKPTALEMGIHVSHEADKRECLAPSFHEMGSGDNLIPQANLEGIISMYLQEITKQNRRDSNGEGNLMKGYQSNSQAIIEAAVNEFAHFVNELMSKDQANLEANAKSLIHFLKSFQQ